VLNRWGISPVFDLRFQPDKQLQKSMPGYHVPAVAPNFVHLISPENGSGISVT
jgi:hypothetical protein